MMLDGRLDCTSELRNRADQVGAPNGVVLHQDPFFFKKKSNLVIGLDRNMKPYLSIFKT